MRIVGASLAAALIAFVLHSFRLILLTPFVAVLVVADILRWVNRFYFEEDRCFPPRTVLALAPFSMTWFFAILIPTLASLLWPPLATPATIVVAQIIAMDFAWRLTRHYLHYLTAHHCLARDTQAKWRSAFAELWRHPPHVTPAREDLTIEERTAFKQSLRVFGTLRWRFVSLAVVSFIVAVTNLATTEYIPTFCLVAIVTIAMFAIVLKSKGGQLRTTWHAIHNWMNSPEYDDSDLPTPWLASSPEGRRRDRRDHVTFTITLIVSLLLPLATNTETISPLDTISPNQLKALPLTVLASSGASAGALLLLFTSIHFAVGPTLRYAALLLGDDASHAFTDATRSETQHVD